LEIQNPYERFSTAVQQKRPCLLAIIGRVIPSITAVKLRRLSSQDWLKPSPSNHQGQTDGDGYQELATDLGMTSSPMLRVRRETCDRQSYWAATRRAKVVQEQLRGMWTRGRAFTRVVVDMSRAMGGDDHTGWQKEHVAEPVGIDKTLTQSSCLKASDSHATVDHHNGNLKTLASTYQMQRCYSLPGCGMPRKPSFGTSPPRATAKEMANF